MSLKLPVVAAVSVAALSLAGTAGACDTIGFLNSGKQAMNTLTAANNQAIAGNYASAQAKSFQAYRQAAGSPMPCGQDSRSARAHLLKGISIYVRGIGQVVSGHLDAGTATLGGAGSELIITGEFLKNSHGR